MEEELLTVERQSAEGGRNRGVERVHEEKSYFDLSSQLDDGDEFMPSQSTVSANDTSSMELDTVFQGIKQNIEESGTEESYRLHYELGIAYQQMDRTEEAIEEFKMALADSSVKNDCFVLPVFQILQEIITTNHFAVDARPKRRTDIEELDAFFFAPRHERRGADFLDGLAPVAADQHLCFLHFGEIG